MAGGLAAGIAFVALFLIFPIPSGLKDGTNIIIPLERTVRFGSCPAHHVALYDNGAVMYEDESFVAVKGAQKSQVNPEAVKRLVKEFYDAGFFSLRDRYEAQVTDLPLQTTSVTIDGVTKTVYRYDFEPQKLVILENRIDKVAQTAKWVK